MIYTSYIHDIDVPCHKSPISWCNGGDLAAAPKKTKTPCRKFQSIQLGFEQKGLNLEPVPWFASAPDGNEPPVNVYIAMENGPFMIDL